MREAGYERNKTTKGPKAHFSCKRSEICTGYETDIQENANAEIPDSSYAYLAGTGSQIYAGPKEIS